MSIRLTVNGEPREMPENTTVRDLLEALGLAAARVAVEHNRAVLKKDRFPDTVLLDGDTLEIVQFVVGG